MKKGADALLEVDIVDGRLVVSIGVNSLAFAIEHQEIDGETPIKVVDVMTAAHDVRRELRREAEDGTTMVHMLLDKAAFDAWENGGEGFAYDDATPSTVSRAGGPPPPDPVKAQRSSGAEPGGAAAVCPACGSSKLNVWTVIAGKGETTYDCRDCGWDSQPGLHARCRAPASARSAAPETSDVGGGGAPAAGEREALRLLEEAFGGDRAPLWRELREYPATVEIITGVIAAALRAPAPPRPLES